MFLRKPMLKERKNSSEGTPLGILESLLSSMIHGLALMSTHVNSRIEMSDSRITRVQDAIEIRTLDVQK